MLQYTQRINAKVANFFAGDSDLSKCDATHILIAQNKCTPTSLLWLVLKHINCVKCHISEREICDMAMSVAFFVNGYEFRFICDDRHKHWNGVTVNYPPEQVDDPKFIESFKIALGMYPHVNAACTLAELLTNGNVSAERYHELYAIASAGDDSEIMDIISEAHQEKALQDREALRDTPMPDRYNQPGFVYLLQSDTGLCKIGKTKNPKKRAKSYASHVPFKVEFTVLIPSENMGRLEDQLHLEFASKRVNGEWFNLNSEDVEYIKGLAQ